LGLLVQMSPPLCLRRLDLLFLTPHLKDFIDLDFLKDLLLVDFLERRVTGILYYINRKNVCEIKNNNVNKIKRRYLNMLRH
jgi:hypothetical protein